MKTVATFFTLFFAVIFTQNSLPADETEHPTPYRSLDEYTIQDILGWQIYLERDLREDTELCEKTLKLLEIRLYEITLNIPPEALEKIRTVKIWVEKKDPVNAMACYHPDPGWLRNHGVLVEKAGCVEISNAQGFLNIARQQPMVVLHELSHGYHHQFLEGGYENPEIREAWQAAKDAGIYENVLHNSGRRQSAYCMTTPMEYFAELTECYFGENDFYPFVRPELKEHDPRGYELLRKLWGIK